MTSYHHLWNDQVECLALYALWPQVSDYGRAMIETSKLYVCRFTGHVLFSCTLISLDSRPPFHILSFRYQVIRAELTSLSHCFPSNPHIRIFSVLPREYLILGVLIGDLSSHRTSRWFRNDIVLPHNPFACNVDRARKQQPDSIFAMQISLQR
jgi:hypothetical protein